MYRTTTVELVKLRKVIIRGEHLSRVERPSTCRVEKGGVQSPS